MEKKLMIIIGGIVAVIAVVIGFFMIMNFVFVGISSNDTKITNESSSVVKNIPSEVLLKFNELSSKYDGHMQTDINLCRKDSSVVYIVDGNTGYVGETFYYDESGKLLGNTSVSDALNSDEKIIEAPIKVEEYFCEVIN